MFMAFEEHQTHLRTPFLYSYMRDTTHICETWLVYERHDSYLWHLKNIKHSCEHQSFMSLIYESCLWYIYMSHVSDIWVYESCLWTSNTPANTNPQPRSHSAPTYLDHWQHVCVRWVLSSLADCVYVCVRMCVCVYVCVCACETLNSVLYDHVIETVISSP